MNKLLLMPQTKTTSQSLASHNVARWQDLREAMIARREELGLSQAELAKKMGITQPAVSQFESLGANPRIMTLLLYAQALELKLDLGAQGIRG